MVWRQLPKLVPAGSIPVSCSTEKGRQMPPFFCGAGTKRTTSAHRVKRAACPLQMSVRVRVQREPCAIGANSRLQPSFFINEKEPHPHILSNERPARCGCRFAFEQRENLAPQAQIPVSSPLFLLTRKNHIRTQRQTIDLCPLRMSVRVRATREPCAIGANSRLISCNTILQHTKSPHTRLWPVLCLYKKQKRHRRVGRCLFYF